MFREMPRNLYFNRWVYPAPAARHFVQEGPEMQVYKELDYATNFMANGTGEWRDSGLGEAK